MQGLPLAHLQSLAAAGDVVDAGSTAWMLTSSALVLLMVPGLALFYGGMVRSRSVLTTMMHSFVAMAIIGVQWVLIGYCLAFGKTVGGVFGWDPALLGLSGIAHTQMYGDKGVPELVFVMFQGKFAIITPALISGAIAERMRFRSFVLFTVLWVTFVYCPLAHWVWSSDGFLFQWGVLDFAGGTVVHISAGVSALVLAILVGARRDWTKGTAMLPNNLTMTLTGVGLLWFGWFGFNAGSAVAAESPVAGAVAGLAFTTTQTAAASAALVWIIIERLRHGKATTLGMASGIVAGLVAITPAAGHVLPMNALFIGAAASIACFFAVQLKNKLGYDDSLDAFGVHGVGGIVGALLTGVFAFTPVVGLLGGNPGQLGKQAVAVVVAVVFAGLGTLVIALFVKKLFGLRVEPQHERDGLDLAIHGERGYHHDLA
ncbi:MAG: ammonium transporter [Deltaproteobacteria bacterium]|nr:ammonium transporter [Deltaproteobacteria bacterium]